MTDQEHPQTPVRVLVVDDEVDYATALAARLRRRGFAADAVFSGTDGLTRAGEGTVDVMLLDLKMPGLDGLDTLRALRRVAPRVRVIVLTGHGTVGSGIEGMQIGAADFFQKPADIDTLCAAIVTVSDDAAVAGAGQGEKGNES